MLLLLSVLLKLAGTGFLCIAALGVMKLPDPFQRMHAATKAGTLGAGLVLLGSIIAHGDMEAVVLGLLTLLFLLLTVPVAGHLLGRAAYVSGARLALAGGDALEGVLRRAPQPLDERTQWPTGWPAGEAVLEPDERPAEAPFRHLVEPRGALKPFPALEAVRFAVIDGEVQPPADRACAIAKGNGASLTAYVLIDTHAIAASSDHAQMRRRIRDKASAALRALKTCTSRASSEPVLVYDEGDPEQLLLCADEPGRTLLVLPCKGWFHHQAEGRRDLTTWDPDGLLRLPSSHRGPVLFTSGKALSESARTLVVRDCGEEHLPALTEWALLSGLWDVTKLVHVTNQPDSPSHLAGVARRFGCDYVQLAAEGDDSSIPAGAEGVRAVILGHTPRPLRTSWYGTPWRERIAPGLESDVLIMEPQTGNPA
ncbi:multicomponent potassium-proton antiporter subunit G [Pannonibacter phragmitetus]|uniref:monovalent cation/H(+) antiporter subunit G n=1 Tax=Pannonibacter phragmitetus TaxID=121719 RepID=UPI00067BE035|nr:monovalent cation/H(+) antiporter subunit G [Pannonibacter phragmitetus]KND19057.1 multicomponent potassium-proton antiporter subunit G [Pannonibacter phragmitetus]